MASEIRVDTSKNTSGLCTVTYSNTGAVLSGITTGTFSGDITGDITGNVTGNMSGGSVSATTGAFSSDVVLTQDPQGFVDDSAQPQASFLIKHGTSGTNRRWVGIGASLTGAWLQSSSPGGSGLAAPFWINKGGGEVRFGTYGTKLFIKNASAATVGIGTDDPDASLEIYKGSAGTYLKAGGDNGNNGRALTFTSSATINSVDGGKHTINATSAHGELALATAGTDRLRIDKSGRLLYGTTSSTRETSLVLVGNSNSYTTNPAVIDLFVGNTPSNLGSMGQICFGTQNVVGARIDGRADQDWTVGSARGTHLRFLTCDNDTTQLDERLRITNAGRVLFGTATSTYGTSDIGHEIKKDNSRTYTAPLMSQHSHLLINNSDTTTNAFCGIGIRAGTGDGSLGFVYTGSANSADFVINTDGGSNGVERLRILNGGNIGIGTDNPGYKLHVSQTSSAVARFERTSGAWTKVDIKAGSSSGNSYLTFSDTDASEVGAINYEHGDNSLRFETYDGSNKQLRAVLDTSGNFYVADQPSFSIRTSDANSFGTSSAHFSLSYASPIPIFTSGNTTTEHHVGSVLTYHDYVAGSNTGRYVKFTAPVAGNYLFGINAECNVAADDWVGFGFEINNTGTHNATLERLVAWTHNQSAEDGTAQARRRSFQGSCLIRLAASDYVVPYQQSSGTSTMQNTFRVWGMLVN